MRTIHDKVCYLRFKSVKISNADNNYIGKYYKWDNNLISKLVIYARKKGWYELLFVDLNFSWSHSLILGWIASMLYHTIINTLNSGCKGRMLYDHEYF